MPTKSVMMKQIRVWAKKLWETKQRLKELTKEGETLVDELRPEVIRYGDPTDPRYPMDRILNLDGFKLHNCAHVKEKINSDACLNFIRGKIDQAFINGDTTSHSHWSNLLDRLRVTREDVDHDVLKFMAGRGELPEELVKVSISEKPEYRFNIYEIK